MLCSMKVSFQSLTILKSYSHLELITLRECISERVTQFYFKQTVDGVSYLYETEHVAHRDFKPENLLSNSDFQLKIADFGLSERDTYMQRNPASTHRYAAPEIIEGRRYCSQEAKETRFDSHLLEIYLNPIFSQLYYYFLFFIFSIIFPTITAIYLWHHDEENIGKLPRQENQG